jgi:hydrogenase nickel incorporation protein HypA/HybF
MHEYSIVQALMERVEKEVDSHEASAVHRIHLKIGELSGVEVDLLRSAYELFRQRSVCDGAELEIIPVAARWGCSGCGKTIQQGDILRCPECARPARLVEGDEIVLERLELEVA